jgi:hypothetical protein
MDKTALLQPVIALVIWSLIVWVWLYATRLPAMRAAGIDPQEARHKGALDRLPSSARQVVENYNHLMEQPTIFYAAALTAAIAGAVTPVTVGAAWAYVGLRILHSLIQNTVNIVVLRFLVFSLSTLALAVLAVSTMRALF